MIMGELLSELLNPFGLSPRIFIVLWALKCCGVAVFDAICLRLERFLSAGKKLASRGTSVHLTQAKQFSFGIKDKVYILINSVIDFVYIHHVLKFVTTSTDVKWTLGLLLSAFACVFVVYFSAPLDGCEFC